MGIQILQPHQQLIRIDRVRVEAIDVGCLRNWFTDRTNIKLISGGVVDVYLQRVKLGCYQLLSSSSEMNEMEPLFWIGKCNPNESVWVGIP